MSEDSKTRLFFGGIPTEPDVKKLVEAFGTPAPGLIPHKRLEDIVGEKRTTPRYRTVVGAWRARLLRESNVGTAAEPGEGIRVLTEAERVDEGRKMLGRSARRVLRQHRWNLMIDAAKLDDVARHKYDHLVRHSAAVAAAAQTNVRELAVELKAPQQLPRRSRA